MSSIRFTCRETLPLTPRAIAEQILDVANWPGFTGYGVLPGIREATFEVRTAEVVGSRIRVINTDGSTHVEEIIAWEPDSRLVLRLHEFSPPLLRLAREFLETWSFERLGAGTKVNRSFELFPRSFWTYPALWLISWLLKPAIQKHLRQMREAA